MALLEKYTQLEELCINHCSEVSVESLEFLHKAGMNFKEIRVSGLTKITNKDDKLFGEILKSSIDKL